MATLYDDPEVRKTVLDLRNKGLSIRAIAKEIGVSLATVHKCLANIDSITPLTQPRKAPIDECEVEHDLENGNLGLFILSPRIKTPEEALAKASLDPNEWEITKCIVKSWEVGCKIEGTNHHGHKFTRGIAVEPLYGLTIHCKKRKGYSPDIFLERLREALRASYKASPKGSSPTLDDEYQAVISIPDVHFGKLAWHETSRDTYTLDIARERYMEAIAHFTQELPYYQPSVIHYVVGNDGLHVDNGRSTTTKGTYVESDCKWQDAYIQLAATIRDTISVLKKIAPVNVIVVPGNHDEEKMFTMGHALGWMYENDSQVTVDCSPILRKYVMVGNTLMMLEHGHNMEKEKKSIGHLMASEEPDLWAKSKFREVITGHWHHKKNKIIESHQVDTIKDVIIRFLPSLSGTDEWHSKKGYINVKAAELHVYHREHGHCSMFEYRV